MTEQEKLDEESSDKFAKEQKLLREKEALLNSLVADEIKSIRQRVAYILNHYPPARNSDSILTWMYWKLFEADRFEGDYLSEKGFMKLTKMSSLIRVRAKIQNEYNLFGADEKIQSFREQLRGEYEVAEIKDKPSVPLFSIYLDESGKTQKYLSVGSLWITNFELNYALSTRKLKDWKKEKEVSFEFHFAELKKHRLQIYKDFFLKFVSLFPTVGFKLIVVNRSGFGNLEPAITDLTYHLINKGIEHEHSSGRAQLPRLLHVNIDNEEKGSDMLKLENIKERLVSQNIDDLFLGRFEAKDSRQDLFVQVVDLFVASVNRKIHNPDGTNFKDELANFILDTVNFDISVLDLDNSNIDTSVVFNLTLQQKV